MVKVKDKKILKVMQEQKLCVPQLTKIAHRVQEPTSTVRDRLLALEEEKVIKGYIPEIDPEKVGQEVLVFVLANVNNLENPDPACKAIAKYDFVQGVYFLVGEKDIFIKTISSIGTEYSSESFFINSVPDSLCSLLSISSLNTLLCNSPSPSEW